MAQKTGITYTCATCGQPVVVTPGELPRRACAHADAGILAHCQATLTGQATVA